MWASGAESSQEFERGRRLRQGWESLAFRWGRGRIPPGDSLTRSRSENCSQTTHFCICVWDNMILCTLFINKHGCTKEMLNFLKFLMVCSGNVCNRYYVFPDWAKNICLSAIIFQCELRQNFTPRLIMNLRAWITELMPRLVYRERLLTVGPGRAELRSVGLRLVPGMDKTLREETRALVFCGRAARWSIWSSWEISRAQFLLIMKLQGEFGLEAWP